MAGFNGGTTTIQTDTTFEAKGDLIVGLADNSACVLSVGSCGNVLSVNCCTPVWTASPSITGLTLSGDLTVSGGCITLTGAATDIDLIDDNASALSFDSNGKSGILEIVTTNCSEAVKMSGDLTVTGDFTVNGTTNTVNSTVTTVADPLTIWSHGTTGTRPRIRVHC